MSLLFLSLHRVFSEFLGDFMKASFFPLSNAFQYSPGPILNKVHNISGKYKPPIKKMALLYFSGCSRFSVNYCPALYPPVLLTLGKSTTKSQRHGYPLP